MQLAEIQRRWPNHEAALRHLEHVRWGGSPTCPYCASGNVGLHASKDKTSPRWQCRDCHRTFSATVGTVFHQTHLPMNKWLLAVALMLHDAAVSAAEIGRVLGVPYKTAWSIAQRIRTTLNADRSQADLFARLVDATNVGAPLAFAESSPVGVRRRRAPNGARP